MLDLQLSASAVKELKKAIDMGIGINLSLGIGGQVTVSGGGGFDPVAFMNGREGCYFRVSPSTCWTDTAGTTPAAVGDEVERLDDLSGQGHNALQSLEGRKPTLRQDAAGKYYLEFDPDATIGNRKHMVINELSAASGVNFLAGAVKSISEFALQYVFDSAAERLILAIRQNTNLSGVFDGAWKTGTNDTQALQVLSARVGGVGSYLRANGTKIANGTWAERAISEAVTISHPQNPIDGAFYGGCIRSGDITAEELAQVEADLSSISGATLA